MVAFADTKSTVPAPVICDVDADVSVVLPPNSKLAPAITLNVPLLVPPASSASKPAFTLTVPEASLLNSIPPKSNLAPGDVGETLTVPSFMKADAAPAGSTFWICAAIPGANVNDPELIIFAPPETNRPGTLADVPASINDCPVASIVLPSASAHNSLLLSGESCIHKFGVEPGSFPTVIVPAPPTVPLLQKN